MRIAAKSTTMLLVLWHFSVLHCKAIDVGQSKDADEAMNAHVRNLADQDATIQQNAINEILKSSTTAVPALVEALDDADAKRRLKVLRLLSKIKDPASFDRVKQCALSDNDWMVRHEAISVVGEFASKDATDTLKEVLKHDSHQFNRVVALRLLSFNLRKEFVPTLQEYLKDHDAYIQVNAARELGRYGVKSGYRVAKLHLENPDLHVRSSAVEALGTIGESKSLSDLRRISNDTEEHQRVRFAAARAIKQIEFSHTPEVERLPLLRAAIRDESWAVRTWAANELVGRSDEESLELLKTEAANSNSRGREEAASALNRISQSTQ